jgi:hypothetical protein
MLKVAVVTQLLFMVVVAVAVVVVMLTMLFIVVVAVAVVVVMLTMLLRRNRIFVLATRVMITEANVRVFAVVAAASIHTPMLSVVAVMLTSAESTVRPSELT